MLLLLVPLRRLLARLRFVLGKGGLVPAAAVYGTLAGGTTGSGVVLISILMASGLQGSAVIATDAVISIGIGVVKTLTFGVAGALGPPLLVFAGLIGLATFPGGFVARHRRPLERAGATRSSTAPSSSARPASSGAGFLAEHDPLRLKQRLKAATPSLPLAGRPTRPERPSGVGGAGVEHGGGKSGIVGAPRTCPDV
jgi:hypothetical protein